ncbi:MAG TPA: MFS transporter [Gemmatimonadales bacterium]|nr:MFS transporter [Gemmatimonadales bacterium]
MAESGPTPADAVAERAARRARPGLLRALRHPNYRLFFSGQLVSLIGTWITRIATSWLVYRLTGSDLLLGVVGFCGLIPTLVLGPVAGVFVDRWNRHRVLVGTQVLSMLQSLALAVLTLTHRITVADILVLQVFQGLINAFDTPARQAFVVTMIEDRADLPNAIALNSSMFNASRIAGPALGGVIIAAVGEGWCFMIDAISYLAVIASLLLMRLPDLTPARRESRVLEELREGYRYVSGFTPIRSVLLLLALVSMASMPYVTLMPAIATETLHGGANTLGCLMAASGVGALVGALYLASRASVLGLGRAIAVANLVFGLALGAFALSRALWLSLLVLPVVGAGFMIATASTNTIVQTIVSEEIRGRVMAFYAVAFLGTAPIGSLLAGVIAERIGAPATIFLGGGVCVAGAGWFALRLPHLRRLVRPIYVERGILPAAEAEARAGL